MKQTITIDGASWQSAIDAIEGLLEALRPISGHGSSIDAFVDSMIYGGMLEVRPPYEVIVENVRARHAEIFVEQLAIALMEARKWRRANHGNDIDVSLRRGS